MANNSGTLIVAPIRPVDENDTYPTALANEIKGGFHAVQTIIDRDAITEFRRIEGMLCFVIDELLVYQLQGGILNTNWVLFETGGGGNVDGYTIEFTDTDLSSGSLILDHNLMAKNNIVHTTVSDNSNDVVDPDNITIVSNTRSIIDLSTYTPLSGTWTVLVTALIDTAPVPPVIINKFINGTPLNSGTFN